MNRIVWLIGLLCFAFLGPLAAEEIPADELFHETESQELIEGKPDRFTEQLAKMLSTLTIFIAVLLVLAWFLKYMMGARVKQLNESSYIKIIDQRSLSPKAMLYIVEIEDQQFLIGETAHGVAPIATLQPSAYESNEK